MTDNFTPREKDPEFPFAPPKDSPAYQAFIAARTFYNPKYELGWCNDTKWFLEQLQNLIIVNEKVIDRFLVLFNSVKEFGNTYEGSSEDINVFEYKDWKIIQMEKQSYTFWVLITDTNFHIRGLPTSDRGVRPKFNFKKIANYGDGRDEGFVASYNKFMGSTDSLYGWERFESAMKYLDMWENILKIKK